MNEKINKHQLGLTVGILVALGHLIWAILVVMGSANLLLSKILSLHFINITFTIRDFNVLKAIILLIVTFIGGYIIGWVFAAIWNRLSKPQKIQ